VDDEQHGARGPRGSLRTNGVHPILAALLILALLAAAMLTVRLRGERDDNARLRTELAQSRRSLDELRGSLRATTSDPLERIEKAVEQLRGLKFVSPVRPEILTNAELAKRVDAQFRKDNVRADLDHTAAVLKTFGVLPADYDLYARIKALQEEQVAGFYDDKTKKLVIGAKDAQDPSPLAQVLLAHELTHALTDQHFGLARLQTLRDAHKDDEAAAMLALAEGDATFLMQLYESQILTAAEQQQLVTEYQQIPQAQFDSAPPFLKQELQFPYDAGLSFVRALHSKGGFAAVDRAYKDPPRSSEQITHPSKYFDARDDPADLALPDVKAKLGSSWKRIEAGQMGEFDVRLVLDQYVGATQSRAAAAGWDAGPYAAFASGTNTLVALETEWDSETEAREAARTFGDWLPLRYGNQGSAFDVAGSDGAGWQGPAGAGLVVRSGARALLVLGPEPGAVRRARSAFAGF
jgi:hypothetical protein